MTTCNIIVEPESHALEVPSSLGHYHQKETEGFSVTLFFDIINKRVKIIDYHISDYDAFTTYLDFITVENNLTKIIMVAREADWQQLFVRGFILEALHPSFFRGNPGFHVSKFFSLERKTPTLWEQEQEVLKKALQSASSFSELPQKYEIRTATTEDIPLLIPLFSRVFETYPTPLNDEQYMKQIMEKNTLFKIILYNNQIISAASIDIDKNTLSAELTDCATLSSYRGQGLMSHLVAHLEQESRSLGLITLYTIARSISTGINAVFSRHNYIYYGTFVNNCDICGKLENMNLWSKRIDNTN